MRRNRTGIQERERGREGESPARCRAFFRPPRRSGEGGTGKRARGAPRPVISTRRVQGRVGTGQPRGGTFGALPTFLPASPPGLRLGGGQIEFKPGAGTAAEKTRGIAPRCAIYACGLPFTRSRLPLRGSSRA